MHSESIFSLAQFGNQSVRHTREVVSEAWLTQSSRTQRPDHKRTQHQDTAASQALDTTSTPGTQVTCARNSVSVSTSRVPGQCKCADNVGTSQCETRPDRQWCQTSWERHRITREPETMNTPTTHKIKALRSAVGTNHEGGEGVEGHAAVQGNSLLDTALFAPRLACRCNERAELLRAAQLLMEMIVTPVRRMTFFFL